MFLQMCAIESLVAVGTAVLVLIVMPQFDVLTNLCIPGGVCILSSVLQIVFRLQRDRWMIIYPICSIILVVSGYVLLGVDHYVRVSSYVPSQKSDCYVYIAIAIVASLLISLNWWENPFQASNNIQDMLSELDGFKDTVYLVTSLIRIAITMGVYFLYYGLILKPTIVWTAYTKAKGAVEIGLALFFLQAFCSAACHWFGVVACKIHAVKFSFALPISFSGPATLIVGISLFLAQAEKLYHLSEAPSVQNYLVNNTFWPFCSKLADIKDRNNTPVMLVMLEISNSICKTTLNSPNEVWPFSMLVLEGVCMWLGLVACTYYVWRMKVQRIERTSQLFVRRLYESAFIDLSLLLNTKMKVVRSRNKEQGRYSEAITIQVRAFRCEWIRNITCSRVLSVVQQLRSGKLCHLPLCYNVARNVRRDAKNLDLHVQVFVQ